MKPTFQTAGKADPEILSPESRYEFFKLYAHDSAQDLLGYDIVRHTDGVFPDEDEVEATVIGEDGRAHDLIVVTFPCLSYSGREIVRCGYVLVRGEVEKYKSDLDFRCEVNPNTGVRKMPIL